MVKHGRGPGQYQQTSKKIYGHGGRKSKAKIMLAIQLQVPATTVLQRFSILNSTGVGAGMPNTYPSTVGGLRWSFELSTVSDATGTLTGSINWGIIVQRGSNTTWAIQNPVAAGTASQVNAMFTGCTPADVMVFGSRSFSATSTNELIEGSSKTMRKINTGDSLWLAVVGSGTAVAFQGTLQFFNMV